MKIKIQQIQQIAAEVRLANEQAERTRDAIASLSEQRARSQAATSGPGDVGYSWSEGGLVRPEREARLADAGAERDPFDGGRVISRQSFVDPHEARADREVREDLRSRAEAQARGERGDG